MKWMLAALFGLLAVPVMAQQNRKSHEIPTPRYAPGYAAGAPADASSQPSLYGNPRAGLAPPADSPSDAGETRGGHEGLAHVGAIRQKLRPPELLAEALSTSQDAFRDGRKWSLVDALARAGERPHQVAITQAYWKLAGAQADYHFARDRTSRLWKATERHADRAAVLSARHSAEAAVDDAEVGVVAAQHELAEQMRLPPDEVLPLAVDQPHVGEYRTQFDTLFNGRTPPARLWLTNRALPVRRKAIDVHGEAILAAQDALDATVEDYERGTTDLATLLASFEEFGHQRHAFVAAVRDYNQDIAEYALTVAPAGANGERLVAMSIKTPAARRAAPDARRSYEPREQRPPSEDPLRDRTFRDDPPGVDRRQAPPAGDYRSAPPADYRAAPPADYRAAPQGGYRSSAVEPARGGATIDRGVMPVSDESPAALGAPQEPAAAPGSDGSAAGAPAVDGPPAQDPFGGRRYDARKPLEHEESAVSPAAHEVPITDGDRGEYTGLWHLAPALRAQKLAGILHWWERSLPPDSGEPTSLAAVLKHADPAARKAVIDAYWRAREAAARYQIYGEAGDHLAPLASAALRAREVPGGVATMLRLQAARLGLHSALLDANVELLVAEWELATAAGVGPKQPWPLPTTIPHAGRYRLPAHRQTLGGARPAADSLLPLEAAVQERAAAVVYADAARAEAAHPRFAAPAELNLALLRVYRQTRASEAFLRTQTDYNLAIAEFALRTLPPAASVEQLVSRLVIPRNSKDGA